MKAYWDSSALAAASADLVLRRPLRIVYRLTNVLFMEHFQSMAHGHFIIKRLEALHGVRPVKLAYERLA